MCVVSLTVMQEKDKAEFCSLYLTKKNLKLNAHPGLLRSGRTHFLWGVFGVFFFLPLPEAPCHQSRARLLFLFFGEPCLVVFLFGVDFSPMASRARPAAPFTTATAMERLASLCRRRASLAAAAALGGEWAQRFPVFFFPFACLRSRLVFSFL